MNIKIDTKMTRACIALVLSLASTQVLASDPATDRDACLVGTWIQTGGGVGEWMQQRMPNQQAKISFDQGRGVMVLQADGRYTANVTGLAVEAIHNDPAGFRQSLRAQASAAGQWSTRDRQLVLDVERSHLGTSDDAITQAAERLRAKRNQGGGQGRVFYGCRGDHLSTQTEIRAGERFPTHYQRLR